MNALGLFWPAYKHNLEYSNSVFEGEYRLKSCFVVIWPVQKSDLEQNNYTFVA